MPSLLALPRELRDHIWVYACERNVKWSSFGYSGSRRSSRPTVIDPNRWSPYDCMRICRLACNEITPVLYRTACVSVVHPNQVIRWLGQIGARNSACIRHLVIRFTSLLLKYNEENYVKDRILAWDAALRALPKLLSLTFDFEPSSKSSMFWTALDDDMFANDPVVGNELAISATAWAKKLQPSLGSEAQKWEYQPELSQRPITHAVFAMDEPIPPLLLGYWAKLLELASKSSLEQNVTGLPAEFFEKSGFYLARTYSFDESPEKPSIAMSFRRQSPIPSSPISSLRVMLTQLPHLLYLRVGCRNIDSTFMLHLPQSISTLDIAFTDTNPELIASRIQMMRERCKRLFTLAIAVSPLHDRELSDQTEEKFFNRQSMSKEILKEWAPFWDALESLKSSGMNVWEGEGPGFKRRQVVAGTVSLPIR